MTTTNEQTIQERYEAAKAQYDKVASSKRPDPNELRQIKAEALNIGKGAADDDGALADQAIGLAEQCNLRAELIEAKEGAARARGARPVDAGLGGMLDTGNGQRERAVGGNGWQPARRVSAQDLDNCDDAGFRDMGDFLAAVADAKQGRRFDKRLEADLDRGYGMSASTGTGTGQRGASDPHGGFLIPERMEAAIIMSADEEQPWLRQRREFTTTSDNLKLPVLDDRDRSEGDVGGLKLTRTMETDEIAKNTAKFRSHVVKLNKAGGLVYVSSELLSDSAVGMEGTLNTLFGRSAAMLQAQDFIDGTGAGEPLGILNSNVLFTADKEGSQAANTITGQNLVDMRSRCRLFNQAIWLAHTGTIDQLTQAHIAGSNSDIFLFSFGNGTDMPANIMGRPVHFTESAKLLGSKGDIALIVPQQYAYLREPMRVDMSMHVAFNTDQHVFRVILRDDGMPLQDETHTDLQGYTTSEFVTLEERD